MNDEEACTGHKKSPSVVAGGQDSGDKDAFVFSSRSLLTNEAVELRVLASDAIEELEQAYQRELAACVAARIPPHKIPDA